MLGARRVPPPAQTPARFVKAGRHVQWNDERQTQKILETFNERLAVEARLVLEVHLGSVLDGAAAPEWRVVRAFVKLRVAKHGTHHEPKVGLHRVAERVGRAAEDDPGVDDRLARHPVRFSVRVLLQESNDVRVSLALGVSQRRVPGGVGRPERIGAALDQSTNRVQLAETRRPPERFAIVPIRHLRVRVEPIRAHGEFAYAVTLTSHRGSVHRPSVLPWVVTVEPVIRGSLHPARPAVGRVVRSHPSRQLGSLRGSLLGGVLLLRGSLLLPLLRFPLGGVLLLGWQPPLLGARRLARVHLVSLGRLSLLVHQRLGHLRVGPRLLRSLPRHFFSVWGCQWKLTRRGRGRRRRGRRRCGLDLERTTHKARVSLRRPRRGGVRGGSRGAQVRDLVVPLRIEGRLAPPRGVRLLPRAYVGRERLRGERRAGHRGGVMLFEPRRHRGPLVRVPILHQQHGIFEEFRGDGTHELQRVQVRRLVRGHGLRRSRSSERVDACVSRVTSPGSWGRNARGRLL